MLRDYYAIRTDDLEDGIEADLKYLRTIYIKAYNYHEAKSLLKKMNIKYDYHLIPGHLFRCRDIIKGIKYGIPN